ncbi:MAG: glycyl-radical enzyme activating protein [Clostridia bacterium]|nr:glycyl-radical enzyme activating protein [Clostridia bacterium]
MKGNERAMVFDVQRYSLHDGPGIRTIIFLKGCPLRCLWCCNPESQKSNIEMEYYIDSCKGCGRCASVCKHGAIDMGEIAGRIDKTKCINCGKCAQACPYGAIRLVGKQVDTDEIMEQIKSDMKYFKKSGGGVTLSGGEPLAQIDFCEKILKECYDLNINTAVETTGYVPTKYIHRIMDYVDVFLYDIKSVDDERHKKLTGVSNELIINNIRLLRDNGKNVIMRIPLIPENNFVEEELEAMWRLANEIGIKEINIMPYHNLGEVKYERLSEEYKLKGLDSLKFSDDMEEQIEHYNYIFEKYDDIKVTY